MVEPSMQYSKNAIAIGYSRVSTARQGRSGLSLEDQQQRIEEFCRERGLELVASFVETESGKNSARPKLVEALALAKRRGGMLVCSTLDRLGRKVKLIADLMDSKVAFACTDYPDDPPFILHIRASVAEEEGRKISERTRNALAVAKARGTRLGGPLNPSPEARKAGAETMRRRAAAANAEILPMVTSMRADGASVHAIAAAVGTSPMTISRLLRREA